VLFLLTFECFTLFLEVLQTIIKYSIHLYDLTLPQTWEHRSTYIYYTEFITDSLVLFATIAHYLHILYLHGISFTLIDAALFIHLRTTYINLRQKISSYRNYRTIASYLRDRYPDVSEAELAGKDEICTICRDTLTSAKRLPCGHLFHFGCLRQWLEAHHICPTCRMSLIDGQYPPVPPNPNDPGLGPFPEQLLHPNGGAAFPNNNGPEGAAPPHPLFPMHPSRFLAWFPNLVDAIRRDDGLPQNPLQMNFPVNPQDVQALREMFPHISAEAISHDLARTGNLQLTSDNILEGRLPELLPPAPPAVNEAPPMPAPTPVPGPGFATPTPPANPATPFLDRTASFSSDIVSLPPNSFAMTPQERQSNLLKRRQEMLQLARKQYLERSSPSSTSSPAPSSTSSPVPSSTSSPAPLEVPTSSDHSVPSTAPATSDSSVPSATPAVVSEPTPPTEQQTPPLDEVAERRRLLAEAAERRFRRLTRSSDASSAGDSS
jgi:autocrine motility factor receptor